MTKQLKLTSLLLLIAAVTFAQKPQSVVNTTKSNVKDKAVVDTVKKPVTLTTQAKTTGDPKIVFPPNAKGTAITVDSLKTPVTATEQAKTEQVNPPINGVGVVVKKNPGGGASRVGTTNEKGEVIFAVKEKGDYTIALVNDGGDAATNNNNAAAMSKGGPVKGVKVALGHCCATSSIIATSTTNDKGEATFKNLEVGSYKIVVQQAERAINIKSPQN